MSAASHACPGCGRPGRPVATKTVKHLVRSSLSHAVWADDYRYCAYEDCDVVYFRTEAAEEEDPVSANTAERPGGEGPSNPMVAFAEALSRAAPSRAAAASSPGRAPGVVGNGRPMEVLRRVDLKDRARPLAQGGERLVCYCFEHTVDEIVEDARSGRHAIPEAIGRETRAGMCACEVLNPGGG